MSQVPVIHPMEGKGASLTLLWEGDVSLTKECDDVTNGAVDVTGYQVLLVRYYGSITHTGSSTKSVHVGLGGAADTGNSTHDVIVSAGAEKAVDITLLMTRTTDSWQIVRPKGGTTLASTSTPLKFGKGSSAAFAAELHFTIYGMKL